MLDRWVPSPAKARGQAVALRLSPQPSLRAQRRAVAGVGAQHRARMCLGRGAAWHARQQLLTLFSSQEATLPSQGLAASTEEAGGERGAGKGAWGRWKWGRWVMWTPLELLVQPQDPPRLWDTMDRVFLIMATHVRNAARWGSICPLPVPLNVAELGRSTGMGDTGWIQPPVALLL